MLSKWTGMVFILFENYYFRIYDLLFYVGILKTIHWEKLSFFLKLKSNCFIKKSEIHPQKWLIVICSNPPSSVFDLILNYNCHVKIFGKIKGFAECKPFSLIFILFFFPENSCHYLKSS